MNDLATDLQAIDAATLTPLVRLALERDDLDVSDWVFKPFGHSLDDVYGLATSIIRFSGTVPGAGASVPWTLVLKIVRAPATPDDPSSPDNGEREPLAYRSGLLDGASPFRAPRCFGVTERPHGGVWLWLEEIVDDIGREWPAERYMLAARHLAGFNATDVSAASYPWLSRSPLREAVHQMSPVVERLSEAMDNPFVSGAVSRESAAALLALLRKSDVWLEELDQLPQSLCHWDAHRANLFSRTAEDGHVETVAIDWAGVGWGPLGADLSKVLSQTVNFFGLDAASLPGLDASLFEHYVEGLRETGWRGDHRTVRFGYTAACAMRLIVRTAMALQLALDDRARASYERAAGQPFASLARRFAQTLPYYLSLVNEADRLSGHV